MTAARILTVRQPWAWAIIHGGKDVENRVRNIAGDYRGPVLIHAAIGKTAEVDADQERMLLAADEDGRGVIAAWLDGEPIAGGIILGVVDLVDVHTADDTDQTKHLRGEWPTCSPWAERRGWHLVLKNPRALDEPIPYRGALGLRKTEFDVVGDYLAAPWGHPKGQVCTPMGCEPGCYLEPVGRLVATS